MRYHVSFSVKHQSFLSSSTSVFVIHKKTPRLRHWGLRSWCLYWISFAQQSYFAVDFKTTFCQCKQLA